MYDSRIVFMYCVIPMEFLHLYYCVLYNGSEFAEKLNFIFLFFFWCPQNALWDTIRWLF